MAYSIICMLGAERVARPGGSGLAMPIVFWSILGCLIAARSRRLTRTRLAAQIWPDLNDEAARHCLASALWRIRAKLRELANPIVAASDEVAFVTVPALWVDVVAFERRVRPALAHPALLEDPCERCRLERGLRLYRGDFLAGVDQEDVAIERARLRALYLDAMYLLSKAQARGGDWESAVRVARVLCAEEPLREDAQRLLIEGYARCGNRALAVRQLKLCEVTLARELGIGPMPETLALGARLLRASPSPARGSEIAGHRETLVAARDSLAETLQMIDRSLAAE